MNATKDIDFYWILYEKIINHNEVFLAFAKKQGDFFEKSIQDIFYISQNNDQTEQDLQSISASLQQILSKCESTQITDNINKASQAITTDLKNVKNNSDNNKDVIAFYAKAMLNLQQSIKANLVSIQDKIKFAEPVLQAIKEQHLEKQDSKSMPIFAMHNKAKEIEQGLISLDAIIGIKYNTMLATIESML